jgi:hypothetical protein
MCSNPPEFDSHGMWVLIFSSLNELVVDSSVRSSSVNSNQHSALLVKEIYTQQPKFKSHKKMGDWTSSNDS